MHQIEQNESGYWLLTQGSSIYLIENELPFGSAAQVGVLGRFAIKIGTWRGENLWLVNEVTDKREYISLRALLTLPREQFYSLARGVGINYFLNTHRFCGQCGSETTVVSDELAVQCSNETCRHRAYPVICPSIIVAVRRGKEILLANHLRHKGGMYTILAGFVEVGETFEQAVRREVFEETGIIIENLRYFGSQPWPFPNSQMVGFLADYKSGEIRLQESEIYDAKWFSYYEDLPELPPKGTIALELINATLALCAAEEK